MTPARRRWSAATLATPLWALLVVADLAAQPLRALRNPEATDWVAYVTGARLLRDTPGDLFHPFAQFAAQTSLLGHAPTIGLAEYANPPLFAFLLRPLAGLPLRGGLGVWTLLLVLAVGVGVVAARSLVLPSLPARTAWASAAVTTGLLASLDGVGYGQIDPLLLAPLMLAARRLHRHGDGVVAGLVLAAAAVKPQVVWLLLPALLVTRAWRTLLGCAAGLAMWAATGVLLIGPGAMLGWARDTLPGGYVGQTARGAGLPAVLVALGAPERAAFLSAVVFGAVAIALLWQLRAHLQGNLAVAAGTGLVLSVLASPHSFGRDLALGESLLLAILAARGALPRAAVLAVAAGLAFALDGSLPAGAAHLEALVAVAVVVVALRPVAARAVRAGDGGAAPRRPSPSPSPG